MAKDKENRAYDHTTMRIAYDLGSIAGKLFECFKEARELYLFGSRRHRTRSERSDIDLVLRHEGYIRPMDVRAFIDEEGPTLDIFLVEDRRAVSVVNESFVEGNSFTSLVETLSALKIWERDSGKVDADIDWDMIVRGDIIFTKTVLPGVLLTGDNQFIAPELVRNTRHYLEKLTEEINTAYSWNVLDGCAVLCRRLVEALIIEVYEAKGLSVNIKKDSNYLMLEGLLGIILNESSFDIGRNAKTALPNIKGIGDRSAHGRNFTAKHSDLEPLRKYMRDVVESLVHLMQDSTRPNPLT